MTILRRAVVAGAAVALLPFAAGAQTAPTPGFYIGAEGGLSWLLNTTVNTAGTQFANVPITTQTGWAAGGVIGYDFIGPRVELEGVYRQNQVNSVTGAGPMGAGFYSSNISQLGILVNGYYDFLPDSIITPYIGAGLGIGFVDGTGSLSSTVFAFQGIVGASWHIDNNFRLNLDGRYYGTSNPSVNGNAWSNNNFAVMLGLQYKFGPPEVVAPPPPPPAPAAPSFMVFFDWDRSNLSQQALSTIQQAADAYKTKGSARITATGHTDTSGPANYNMALSLRRANAVKDALVRDGVPATAISVIGKGETQPLVPTGDGVREPQNRRVEIVLQ
jgi:opacity protein-like surface antigen